MCACTHAVYVCVVVSRTRSRDQPVSCLLQTFQKAKKFSRITTFLVGLPSTTVYDDLRDFLSFMFSGTWTRWPWWSNFEVTGHDSSTGTRKQYTVRARVFSHRLQPHSHALTPRTRVAQGAHCLCLAPKQSHLIAQCHTLHLTHFMFTFLDARLA